MKICDGLVLDPRTFHQQVRGLRHVRPLAEARSERATVEALHKAWVDHLDTVISQGSAAATSLNIAEYGAENYKAVDAFNKVTSKLIKLVGAFERHTRKWRSGVNLYFERDIDVTRLKSDLKASLTKMEKIETDVKKAVAKAKQLKITKGDLDMAEYDAGKFYAAEKKMADAMRTAIKGL